MELEKLLDPKVKAFFLVNRSNPPPVKISDESLKFIAEVIKERPDLILLTEKEAKFEQGPSVQLRGCEFLGLL